MLVTISFLSGAVRPVGACVGEKNKNKKHIVVKEHVDCTLIIYRLYEM